MVLATGEGLVENCPLFVSCLIMRFMRRTIHVPAVKVRILTGRKVWSQRQKAAKAEGSKSRRPTPQAAELELLDSR
jgi:hypothetical protein